MLIGNGVAAALGSVTCTQMWTKMAKQNGVTNEEIAEAMLANKATNFFTDYREKGIPASNVPDEVVEPLVKKVMSAPEEMLINISDVFDYKLEPKKDSFNGFVCDECGEMTVEEYGRIKNGKHVCIDCAAN